jgi:polyphosphate glucokinase
MLSLGIDIGGSGIKGAIVDCSTGALASERIRVDTPQNMKDVIDAVLSLVRSLGWEGPVGCTFPAVVMKGKVLTAANIDKNWIGSQADILFSDACGQPFVLLNDADAAGIAEMRFGSGMNWKGTVIIVTVGTGIGTAIFSDGILLRNTEFGHILFKGKIAEAYCSDHTRKRLDLGWKDWGIRFNEYLLYLEKLFYPELIIVGGGASKKYEKFSKQLNTKAKVLPAALLNDAGIVGAALAAIQIP